MVFRRFGTMYGRVASSASVRYNYCAGLTPQSRSLMSNEQETTTGTSQPFEKPAVPRPAPGTDSTGTKGEPFPLEIKTRKGQ